MENPLIVKILILLIVLCIKNDANKEKETLLISHICSVQHWENMWFDEILMNSVTYKGWMKKGDYCNRSVEFPPSSNLKTIPMLMGCGYGKSLANFLSVTTYTATECEMMTQLRLDNAKDCWDKFKGNLRAGEHFLHTLLVAFEQIRSLNTENLHSPFYNTLLEIQQFLKIRGPGVQTSLGKGEDTDFTVQSMNYANALGKLLNSVCKPPHKMLTLPKLISQYEKENTSVLYENTQGDRYKFLIDKLNSYTQHITDHLKNLGFHSEGGNEVIFTLPKQSG